MRVIKFRAWDKEKKEMTLNDSFYELQKWNRTEEELKIFDIMQFTGLLDSNGAEIYEGDILRSHNSPDARIAEVVFRNGCFFVEHKQTDYLGYLYFFLNVSKDTAEVIGNIYENPELFGGGK